MAALWNDLRYATRSLWRDRTAFLIAVATLAIGLAANTTVFSLVHALEFPSLPYPHADRVVFLETNNAARDIRGMLVSIPDALSLRDTARTLDAVTITADYSAVLDGRGGRRHEGGRRVDASFFPLLAVAPQSGRTLQVGDEDTAIVLSERLWNVEVGGPWRNDAVVRLEGRERHIVGVMPAAFDPDADYWVPWSPSATITSRDDRQYPVFARLAADVSLEAVRAELQQRSEAGWTMVAFPMAQLHGRDDRAGFFQLQAAVVLVLLIICANVANVLLARHTRQRHESAVRVALGASRGHLLRARLAEGVVLAGVGGGLGLLFALWSIRAVQSLGGFASTIEPTLNPMVLATSLAAALATGLLCAIVPAWVESRQTIDGGMRDGSRSSTGSIKRQRVLVGAQVAGAVVLGVLGTMLLQSWMARQAIDLGFAPAGVVRATVDGIEGIGVPAILATANAPDVSSTAAMTTLGRGLDAVSSDYFDTLGIPILEGRGFDTTDQFGTEPVAVVNLTRAQTIDPSGRVVGRRIPVSDAPGAPTVRIVGVVGATRRSVMHDTPQARTYLPLAQAQPSSSSVELLVRGRDRRTPDLRALTTRLSASGPDVVVSNATTLTEELAQFSAPLRLMTVVLLAFGVMGGLLVALGVFGATSYAMSARLKEFAVRAALGSPRGMLAGLVLRHAAGPAVVGCVVGLGLAAMATRTIESYVAGVPSTDGRAVLVVIAGLLVVVAGAAVRPAWRAAHVDPAHTLRNE